MKKTYLIKTSLVALSMIVFSQAKAQTVFDQIAGSANHTLLEAALIQEGLDAALDDPMATLTVFAPDDNAINALAAALGTDITGLLANPDLSDILTYHVLGSEVEAANITNGDIVTPLNNINTIKLTVTSGGDVYANQAQVNGPNIFGSNGVVHSIDAAILPGETVVDIAIDNGFTYLVAAVVQEELLPALTDPFASLTVFAPGNQAFDDLAAALGTDISGLLALPNLTDVLLYHVLGSEVLSGDISNGDIVNPLSTTNTLKLTVTGGSEVYVNQAMVTAVDFSAANGTVHVLDAVVLPFETVADVAIDNGFTSLVAAVVEAELLPALTNPLAELTVFAPTNQAFDDLATALGTDINGLLASPNLSDILLYHVIGSIALSTDLTNGDVPTLNGQSVTIDITGMDVMVNTSTVTAVDLEVDNGVVHVIDAVLVPSFASIEENNFSNVTIYPNPSNGIVNIQGGEFNQVDVLDISGRVVYTSSFNNSQAIDIRNMENGQYIIRLSGANGTFQKSIHLLPGM